MSRSRPPRVLRLLAQFPGTLGILCCTVVFFALEHALGGAMDPEVLLRLGAMRTDRVVEHFEVWRLVMPMLLHFGALHLVLNLLALIQLGPMVEAFWGTRRMLLFYIACGVVAALGSAAFTPVGHAGSVGASGAIMGLAGVLLGASLYGDETIRREFDPLRGPLTKGVLLTLFLGIALSLVWPVIDNVGHIAGLSTGLLLAAAYPDPLQRDEPQIHLGFYVALAAVAIGIAFTAVDGKRAVDTIAADMAEISAVEVSERPTDVMAIAEMVRWHDEAAQVDEGRERLDRALNRIDDPRLLEALFFQMYGNAPDAAIAATVERVLALEPDNPDMLNAAAWFWVTRSEGARDPVRAEALSRKSLERIPNPERDTGKVIRAQYLDTLAEALYQQGRYPEAREVQQEAVRLATEELTPFGDRFRTWVGLPTNAQTLQELRDRLRKIERAEG